MSDFIKEFILFCVHCWPINISYPEMELWTFRLQVNYYWLFYCII
jgi:hypothetical protein